MANDLVKALWRGTPQVDWTGVPLVPGESVREIPAAEADGSDNWEPQGARKPEDPFKGLKKDKLLALAVERNVEVTDGATVPQIKKALTAAAANAEPPEPDEPEHEGDADDTGDAD